jgi:hypothetical protein
MMSSLMAVLGMDVSPFKRSTMEAGANARAAGKEIERGFGSFINSKLPFLSAAGGFMMIEEGMRHAVEMGERISEMASRLSVSTDAVQLWDAALKKNGSTIEAAAGFFEKLAIAREKIRRGEEGSDKLVENMRRLGVSLSDVMGTKRTEDLAAQIAKTYELGDPQQLVRDMRGLGIRASGELVSAFRNGLAGMVDPNTTEINLVSERQLNILKEFSDTTKSWLQQLYAGWQQFTSHVIETGISLGKIFEGTIKGEWAATKTVVSNLSDLWHGKTPTTNPLTEGVKAFSKTYDDEINRRLQGDAKIAKQREDAKKALSEETESKSELKDDKDIERIKEHIRHITEQTALIGMTSAQKEAELVRRIGEMRGWQTEQILEGDRVSAYKTEEQIAEAQAELSRIQNAKTAHNHSSAQVSERQRIGAYVSPAEMAAQGLMQRSEGHLARMEKHLAKIENLTQRTNF